MTRILSLALLLALCCATAGPAASRSPNVVFILIDDLGYGDFSCTGNRDISTPHIDRLAVEGIRFTQFYSASPICSPSRVAFTTGQHPARWNIHSFLNHRAANRARGMADYLDPSAPCIARNFRAAGYSTAHFGKWHMGGGRDVADAPLPQAYGFDESLVQFEGLGDRLLQRGTPLSDQSAQLGQGKIHWVKKHEETRIYVDRAIRFIENRAGRPFYLQLWLGDVHDPFEPSAEQLARIPAGTRNEEQRKFLAVLDNMDRELGRLFSALDASGLSSNTIVVLTSDNGPTAWPHYYRKQIDPPGSTAGFRGRKWSLYEGGIRVPLIARWPGRIPAGTVNETTLLTAVDLFPSLCRMTGVKAPPGIRFDGEEMSAALLGRKAQRRHPLFWEYPRASTDLRPGLAHDKSPTLAMRDGPWKFLINADGTGSELYNLAHDPAESRNLVAHEASLARKFTKQLLEWRYSLP